MGYGLDSPGNQPIGEMFEKRREYQTRCTNHSNRYAIALWGRQLEGVCLECLDDCVKEFKKRIKVSKPQENKDEI